MNAASVWNAGLVLAILALCGCDEATRDQAGEDGAADTRSPAPSVDAAPDAGPADAEALVPDGPGPEPARDGGAADSAGQDGSAPADGALPDSGSAPDAAGDAAATDAATTDAATTDAAATDAATTDAAADVAACMTHDETCNGLDDDCDGRVDEGLPGSGEPCVVGVGLCQAAGIRFCDPRAGVVRCGAVAGIPAAERCNGLDDDCDDAVDEEEAGVPIRRRCYDGPEGTEGVGACAAGSRTCVDAAFGACVGQVTPAEEVCNGVDDDCDGRIDEGPAGGPLRAACYGGPAGSEGMGRCTGGEALCAGGAFGACVGDVVPRPEICDGADDDCDGAADEGLGCACEPGTSRGCYGGLEGTEGIGVCRAGRQDCLAAGPAWGACAGEVHPTAELCNGLDDDCDGVTDEEVAGAGAACSVGIGACRAGGIALCVSAEGELRCGAVPGAPAPEICNGRDDDCDGATDEDALGLGEPCSVGLGACLRHGERRCGPGGEVACSAVPGAPAEEVCNGADDDCDGATDEDFPRGQPCHAGVGRCLADGMLACDELGGVRCTAEPGVPAVETCDGTDEDCDGLTDEGFDLDAVCRAGVGACTRDGRRVCDGAGAATCDAASGPPAEEICNGVDDDCDDRTDEAADGTPLSEACYSGPAGTAGVGLCREGTRACAGGAFGPCAGEVLPAPEICDAQDRDCNGVIDDVAGQQCGCDPNPCLRGGACADVVAGFRCDCAGTGYEGERCEADVDECAADACDASALCVNTPGAFDCTCPSETSADENRCRCILFGPQLHPIGPPIALQGAIGAIATADIDGDGDLDVVSARSPIGLVGWYENLGGGQFAAARLVKQLGSATQSALVLADFDGDGDIDVVEDQAGRQLVHQVNNGNKTFTDRGIFGQVGRVSSLQAADVDEDGVLDLLVTSSTDDRLTWFRGQDGTFVLQPDIARPDNPTSAVHVDLDGDGRLDIVVGAVDGDAITWHRHLGGGVFEAARVIIDGFDRSAVLGAGDLDGDGDPDLVAFGNGIVVWFPNDGQGQLGEPLLIHVGGIGSSWLIDVDADGDLDLLGVGTDILWFVNDGRGSFAPAQQVRKPATSAAHPADIDGDGDVDLIVGIQQTSEVRWMENRTLALWSPGQTVGEALVPTALAPAEMDGDGRLDVLVGAAGTGVVGWYSRDGEAFGELQPVAADAAGLTDLAAGDFDRDGDMDVVVTLASSVVLYPREEGGFGEPQQVADAMDQLAAVTALDLDGDGDLDLLTAQPGLRRIRWFRGFGNGRFEGPLNVTDRFAPAWAIDRPADLDGDGHLDLLTVTEVDRRLAWHAQVPGPAFAAPAALGPARGDVTWADAGDVDGDGRLDVVAAYQAQDVVAWYAGQPGGGLGEEHIVARFDAPTFVRLTDLDGDGALDLVLGHGAGASISAARNDGRGGFGGFHPAVIAGLAARAIELADLTGDGAPELVYGTASGGPFWHSSRGRFLCPLVPPCEVDDDCPAPLTCSTSICRAP